MNPPTSHGRLRKAPENFLDAQALQTARSELRQGRRGFIEAAFASALAATAGAAVAQTNPVAADGGVPGCSAGATDAAGGATVAGGVVWASATTGNVSNAKLRAIGRIIWSLLKNHGLAPLLPNA